MTGIEIYKYHRQREAQRYFGEVYYIGAAFITSHHYNQQYFTITGAASPALTAPASTALYQKYCL